MKTKMFFLAFAFFVSASFCMAKTSVIATGPTLVNSNSVVCSVSNTSANDVNVMITLMSSDGTPFLISNQTMVAHGTVYFGGIPAVPDYYYCSFSFQGKAKALRGSLNVINPGNSLVVYALPAN